MMDHWEVEQVYHDDSYDTYALQVVELQLPLFHWHDSTDVQLQRLHEAKLFDVYLS